MRASLVVLAFALAACPAQAQRAPRWWGGCSDAAGRSVTEFANRSLGMVARAAFAVDGSATIEYDPRAAEPLSFEARRFFFVQQCAHHALGQVRTRGTLSVSAEREADCWAARHLAQAGELTAEALRAVETEATVAWASGGAHIPGPPRSLRLAACAGAPAAPEPSAACEPTTAFESRVTYVTRRVRELVQCTHRTELGFAHAFDEVEVEREVPVVQPEAITRRRCD